MQEQRISPTLGMGVTLLWWCDRVEQKVYVAPWSEAVHFVDSQHPLRPPLTREQWEKIKEWRWK